MFMTKPGFSSSFLPPSHSTFTSSSSENIKKKRRLSGCKYETIIQPTKYNDFSHKSLVFSEIPIIRKENYLFTDISLLNDAYLYRDVQVLMQQDKKLIYIKAEKKNKNQFVWNDYQNNLQANFGLDSHSWGQRIKTLSSKLPSVQPRVENSNQNSKTSHKGKHSEAIIDETKPLRAKLFAQYPCMQIRVDVDGLDTSVSEIVFNERYIKSLGYTIDCFTSSILIEGLPQLIPSNISSNSESVKYMYDFYSNIKNQEGCSSEFKLTFLMRSGYLKDIKLQIHYLINKEKEKDGLDLFFVMVNQSTPYEPLEEGSKTSFNKEFLSAMHAKEKEMVNFLQGYYNHNTLPRYSNLDKVCRIKEIKYSDDESDDDFE